MCRMCAKSRVEEKAVDAREGCLDSSYPKGTFQVRRGRTNVEARQEVDPGAGANGRWLPLAAAAAAA
jgi:hypothetical protein